MDAPAPTRGPASFLTQANALLRKNVCFQVPLPPCFLLSVSASPDQVRFQFVPLMVIVFLAVDVCRSGT